MRRPGWLIPAFFWLYGAVAVTGVCGLVYLAVQQNIRESANDPQIQLAEDAAARIEMGVAIENVMLSGPSVDISTSLAPFMAIYNSAGALVLSSATLDGHPLQLPQKLFDTSTWLAQKTYTENSMEETRITWQPEPGVRSAVVVVQTASPSGIQYVAVGRSLREVEDRESQLEFEVFIVWFVTLVALFVLSFGWWRLLRK
jgi:hypothetical protein